MPRPSRRALSVPESSIRGLAHHARAAAARGVHVHHLNIGQPDMASPPEVLDALRDYEVGVLAYGDSRGEAELRETLRAHYASLGVALEADEILATAGASEALQLALAATCDAGDEVLTPDPTYANYRCFAAAADVGLVPMLTRQEEGWALPADLEPFRTPKARAVLLCNPANPTGVVYGRDTLERVLAFCQAHDLYLIVDEVYRELVHDVAAADPDHPGVATPSLSLADSDGRVVAIDSMSKRYSLCGLRVGSLVTRNLELRTVLERIAESRLCTAPLTQQLSARVRHLGPGVMGRIRGEYRARLETVAEELAAMPGVSAPPAQGAFYQVATLPVSDTHDFVRFMLSDFQHEGETAMLAPMAGFYVTPGFGRDQVRVACVLAPEALRRALRCVAVALQAYPGRR